MKPFTEEGDPPKPIEAGWIFCIDDNVDFRSSTFVINALKDTKSPLHLHDEFSPGQGVRCRIRSMAYVSDVALAHTLLLYALKRYSTFPLDPEHVAFRVPSQEVINQATRSVVNALKSLRKADESVKAIMCKAPKPPRLKTHQLPLCYREDLPETEHPFY